MRVVILGMGHSRDEYLMSRLNGEMYDEVWCINCIGAWVKCDKIFMMDDAEYQVTRPQYHWLRSIDTPVISSVARPEINRNIVAYPIDDVRKKFNSKYFSNSCAYAIAYALHTGVKELTFFGVDYEYKDIKHEKNRAGTEFWIGICHALGVKVAISDKSSLLNMNNHKLYGYECGPAFKESL